MYSSATKVEAFHTVVYLSLKEACFMSGCGISVRLLDFDEDFRGEEEWIRKEEEDLKLLVCVC